MKTNTSPRVIRAKEERHASAVTFAKTLVMLRVKKKTALVSIMKQNGVKVREARAVWVEATGKPAQRWK